MKWGEKAVKIKCKQQEMRKDKLRITGEWVQLYFFLLFTNKVVSMAVLTTSAEYSAKFCGILDFSGALEFTSSVYNFVL